MPKVKISEFDIDPANNTDINSINIAEGCAPSGINNAIRQLMSDLKEFQTGGAGDPFNGAVNGTVGATTANTGAFTTLSASGAFSANGGATLGDASGDALTINSSAVSIPNGLNLDSNTLVIDATNNRVGVNIATPAVALDVYSPADSIMFNLRENTSGNGRRIRFSNAGTVNTIESTAAIGATNLAFTIDGNEAMRIDSSRNVGIGTSSPIGRIDALSNATTTFVSRATTTGANQTADVLRVYNADASLFALAQYNAVQHIWRINGTTEGMRIDSSGNLLFNSGYGSVATAYGCRAWVNFNGSGTVTIRASGNVSSITDNGTGDYTVNFTTAMPDANYACLGFSEAGGGAGNKGPYQATSSSSGARVFVYNSGGSLVDSALMNIAIFR